jgi:hypothetical protein
MSGSGYVPKWEDSEEVKPVSKETAAPYTPKWEDSEEVQETPVSSSLLPSAKTVEDVGLNAGIGAIGGIALKYGAKSARLANKKLPITETLGRLDSNQLDYIEKYPKYDEGLSSLEKILGEFKDLDKGIKDQRMSRTSDLMSQLGKTAEEVHSKSYQLADEAKKSLRGLPQVPAKTLYQSVASALTGDKVDGALIKITPEEKAAKYQSILQQKSQPLEKMGNRIQGIDKEISTLQNEVATVQPESDLRTHIETRKRLEQKLLEKKALETQLEQAGRQIIVDAKNQTEAASGIPEVLRKISPDLADKKLSPGYSLDKVMSTIGDQEMVDPDRVGGRLGIIKQLENTLPPILQGSEDPKIKLAKAVTNQLKKDFSENPIYSEYAAKQEAASKAVDAESRLKKLGIELDNKGKPVFSATAKTKVSNWLDDPEKYAGELERLEEALQDAKELNVSVPDSYEDIKKLRETENRFAAAGIKPNTHTGELTFSTSDQQKFVKNLLSGKGDEYNNIVEAVKEAARLQGVPESELDTVVKYVTDQVNAANIKDIVKGGELSNSFAMKSRGKFAGALPGIVGAALGAGAGGAGAGGTGATLGAAGGGVLAHYGVEKYGTQLQEAIAKAKGSKVAQALGSAVDFVADSKSIPFVGAALGAGMGVQSAQAAGFDPQEAAAIGVAEGLNPVPFTDVTEAAKAVRDIPQEELQKASGEVQSYSPGGMPAQAAMVSGEALKGFTKPLRDLGGLAVEGLESAGTSRANDARSRMEQNLNAFRQLKQNNIPVTNQLNEFKSPVQAFQKDDLNNLAQEFRAMGGGAEGFAENLEKAARAEDEDARNRIIHGLSQQPGFRALMNRRNK